MAQGKVPTFEQLHANVSNCINYNKGSNSKKEHAGKFREIIDGILNGEKKYYIADDTNNYNKFSNDYIIKIIDELINYMNDKDNHHDKENNDL